MTMTPNEIMNELIEEYKKIPIYEMEQQIQTAIQCFESEYVYNKNLFGLVHTDVMANNIIGKRISQLKQAITEGRKAIE